MNRVFVSVSGGKTSAKLAEEMKRRYSGIYDMIFGFANTGKEREETLVFADQVDRYFGLDLVWLEAVVYHDQQKSSGHKIVNFETASRNGEPFEEVIKKYGIPNKAFPHCTRELKLNPMRSYLESVGWERGTYISVVGIRADEAKRCQRDSYIEYPFVHWFPMTKPEINDWWDEQPFNLQLKEHEGNCDNCWKKSTQKLVRLAQEAPQRFDWWREMENKYPLAGAGHGDGTENPRTFFRQHMSADSILALAQDATVPPLPDPDADSGCSESCEAFLFEEMGPLTNQPA